MSRNTYTMTWMNEWKWSFRSEFKLPPITDTQLASPPASRTHFPASLGAVEASEPLRPRSPSVAPPLCLFSALQAAGGSFLGAVRGHGCPSPGAALRSDKEEDRALGGERAQLRAPGWRRSTARRGRSGACRELAQAGGARGPDGEAGRPGLGQPQVGWRPTERASARVLRRGGGPAAGRGFPRSARLGGRAKEREGAS